MTKMFETIKDTEMGDGGITFAGTRFREFIPEHDDTLLEGHPGLRLAQESPYIQLVVDANGHAKAYGKEELREVAQPRRFTAARDINFRGLGMTIPRGTEVDEVTSAGACTEDEEDLEFMRTCLPPSTIAVRYFGRVLYVQPDEVTELTKDPSPAQDSTDSADLVLIEDVEFPHYTLPEGTLLKLVPEDELRPMDLVAMLLAADKEPVAVRALAAPDHLRGRTLIMMRAHTVAFN